MRLIDADALMMPINASWRDAGLHSEDYGKIKRWIKNAPTIEAELVKHGRWINDNGLYKCSVCNTFTITGWANCIPIDYMNKTMRYCPNCGARMDMEGENHE